MDDQQRARELAHKIGVYYTRKGSTSLEDGFFGFTETELQAYAAALRASPEVPAARVTEPLRADESRQEQADLAIYNRGWNDCRAALLNQHGVAVVADSSQVVPPSALGAHEVHPEAVDAGLDLGEAGERLLAADALEHASGVRQNCDRSANAPEGFVLVPVEPSVGVLASMAIRRDHGLGCPGYYDAPVFGAENLGHQRRMEVAIGEARQQYAEVVGNGFYSLDREGHYAALAARPQGVK